MANDKDFILKNAVEVGGPTKVTVGTVTSNNVDLSTGNYFVDTPRGVSTYTFSNPADVQAFQLEVTGGTAEVAQNFSTTLYTGNGSTQTITNGIDLANDGGLVWVKQRDASFNHILIDTERGVSKFLYTDQVNAEETYSGYGVTSFNSDGFEVTDTTVYGVNKSGATYASWTFKKAAGFFDIVTYTGNGTSQSIPHNLGTTVGTIIIKRTDTAQNWFVWHRSYANNQWLVLNENYDLGFTGSTTALNNTTPTDSVFTVGPAILSNASGGAYVAYLFAHDTANDGIIACDSFTPSGTTASVDLGWEPQWFILKRSTAVGGWSILDAMRGIGAGEDVWLNADTANAEASFDFVTVTPTGLDFTNLDAGVTYIYIAIRQASDPDITWPTSVQWTGGTAPQSPAVGEKDLYTFVTDDGGTSYVGIQSADNIS